VIEGQTQPQAMPDRQFAFLHQLVMVNVPPLISSGARRRALATFTMMMSP
jgi:hypothetical protein